MQAQETKTTRNKWNKTPFIAGYFLKGGSNNSDKLICALSCVYFC